MSSELEDLLKIYGFVNKMANIGGWLMMTARNSLISFVLLLRVSLISASYIWGPTGHFFRIKKILFRKIILVTSRLDNSNNIHKKHDNNKTTHA